MINVKNGWMRIRRITVIRCSNTLSIHVIPESKHVPLRARTSSVNNYVWSFFFLLVHRGTSLKLNFLITSDLVAVLQSAVLVITWWHSRGGRSTVENLSRLVNVSYCWCWSAELLVCWIPSDCASYLLLCLTFSADRIQRQSFYLGQQLS